MWDDVDPKEMLQAAADAIEKQGKGTKSASAVAAPLREIDTRGGKDERSGSAGAWESGGARERRRKMAARFADTELDQT